MARSEEDQLNIYLQDLYAIELQALEQVKRAPKTRGIRRSLPRSPTTSEKPGGIGCTWRIV